MKLFAFLPDKSLKRNLILEASKIIGLKNQVRIMKCPGFILAREIFIAHQAPLSMGFSGQEYWSGLSFPSSGDLPHPGIEHTSPLSPALQVGFYL